MTAVKNTLNLKAKIAKSKETLHYVTNGLFTQDESPCILHVAQNILVLQQEMVTTEVLS